MENAHFPNNMEKAIRTAFVKADHALADSHSLDHNSGTIALTALIFGREKVLRVLGGESCCLTAGASRGAALTPATLSPSLGPDSGVLPLFISYPPDGSSVEFPPPGPSDTRQVNGGTHVDLCLLPPGG